MFTVISVCRRYVLKYVLVESVSLPEVPVHIICNRVLTV